MKLLESLRASGRRLFLATNSLWDYTHVVMNFLLKGRTGHDKNMDWLEYFDVVITGLIPENGLTIHDGLAANVSQPNPCNTACLQAGADCSMIR